MDAASSLLLAAAERCAAGATAVSGGVAGALNAVLAAWYGSGRRAGDAAERPASRLPSHLLLTAAVAYLRWRRPVARAVVALAGALAVLWLLRLLLAARGRRRRAALRAACALPTVPSAAAVAGRAGWNHAALAQLLAAVDEPLPAMMLNLDAFDANTDLFVGAAARGGKRIRLATKSLRVPWLVTRVLSRHPEAVVGLMCYSVPEARYWVDHGVAGDILVAYPTVQRPDIATAWSLLCAGGGANVTLTIDCVAHVAALDAAIDELVAASPPPSAPATPSPLSPSPPRRLRVCIDADVSYRPGGGLLHLGAHRSPCRTPEHAVALAAAVRASRHLVLDGVMAYEAHIAGLPDMEAQNSSSGCFAPVAAARATLSATALAGFKEVAAPAAAASRRAVVAALAAAGEPPLRFVNGGGSGNALAMCAAGAAEVATEVTVGSGLLQSHLFDRYTDAMSIPALAIALQVTRVPQRDMVVCHSGGFMASGEPGADRAPIAFLPPNLAPLAGEAFGEVQTPLRVRRLPPRTDAAITGDGASLRPGDVALFRPAKTGEIAEHFVQYLAFRTAGSGAAGDTSVAGLEGADAVSAGDLVAVAYLKTYRGVGQAFH